MSAWKYFLLFLTVLVVAVPIYSADKAKADTVTVQTDGSGSKLIVNGADYLVKGVVWGCIPVGCDYSYSLWTQNPVFITNVLNADFPLLTNAGFNTIRVFTQIPPAWIEYIYDRFGIRTVVYDMIETYDRPVRDFGDPAVRKRILESVRKMTLTYKKTRGILFYALGNEQNYHVTSQSNLINMYRLYELCAKEIKKNDRNHPVVIVNGDTKNAAMVRDLCPGIDLFGANVYRGTSGAGVYLDAKVVVKKPLVFTEFGCDALDSVALWETQYQQDKYIKSQWKELYLNTYGKGKGNCVGGFVFQWRDEWWKSGKPLVHDRTASWRNPAYSFDVTAGDNMNEEWFGICALSPVTNSMGFHDSLPREAYGSLTKIFKWDPFRMSAQDIKDAFSGI